MPLPKPQPPEVWQTMHTAFKELEGTITTDDSRGFSDSTLSRVREEALAIENRLAARRSLRNMRRLMPLFTALEHYSKAIDVLCNGTPYMPWIWAPITLILRVASEYVDAFEQLIKGYGRIATSLQRFELLGHAFSDDTQFQQTLAIFYADILQFHKHAYTFVRRNGWRLLFITTWGRFQRRFNNILDDMEEHGKLIDQGANALNISEATKMRQELRAWKEEDIQNQDKKQSAEEFRTIMSWLQMNDSDQISIFESTSSQADKHPGTCTWIQQNRQFRSWLQEGPNTPILWLSGSAGFGKSVIATQVIKFVKIAGKTIFHHFCTYESAASSNYDQVLKSLLQQVLREDAEWTSQVYNDFIIKNKPATVPVLEQLLQTVLTSSFEKLDSVKYIWIVLDGVDELSDDMQMRLFSFVKHIAGKSISNGGGVFCKILISGRSSRTIDQALGKKPKVSLTDQKPELSKAIEEYSRQRLELLGDRFEQLGIETRGMNDIGFTIAKKADGMFLYARLVLDYVHANIFLHQKELRDSIHQLPKELSEFYRKIVAQILAPLDTMSVEHIRCILGWLAFSRRPLKRHELLSAVSFSSGNPEVERAAPEYILSVSGSLIEERNDATITFIHASVQEFLQDASSNLFIEKKGALQQHCVAAVTCLLSSFRLIDGTCDKNYQSIVKGLYEFQVYASEYWADCLLDEAVDQDGLHPESLLHRIVTQLSSGLEGIISPLQAPDGPFDLESEPRLCHLQRYPIISKHVQRSLQARSLAGLEGRLKQQDDNALKRDRERAASREDALPLLSCYQKAVDHILHARDIPGISSNELESFRARSRASAYTCSLRSCPRATLGFVSEEARDEHEVGHARRFHCTSPSCQYPAFYSSQKLKRHMREKHTVTPRREIRQAQTMVHHENDGGITTQSTADESLKHTDEEAQRQSLQPQIPDGSNPTQQQMKQQMAASHAQAQLRAAQAKGLQNGPEEVPGNWNVSEDPAIRAMLAQLDPEQRQKFRQLPADKLYELFSKWKRTGMLRPDALHPAQPQQTISKDPASPANPESPVEQANPVRPASPAEPTDLNPMNRFREGNPLHHPQAQMIMDNMDLPPQMRQIIPGIPPDAKKWGQFKAWVSQTDAPIPDQQKQALRSIQTEQFKSMVQSHGQGTTPQPNPNTIAALPPNTPIPEVTPQEIQQFRMSQQNFSEAPEEQIKMFIQRLKIQRMRQAAGAGVAGQPSPR